MSFPCIVLKTNIDMLELSKSELAKKIASSISKTLLYISSYVVTTVLI